MRLPQLTVSTLEVLLCVGMMGSQWAGAFTASGQGRDPNPIPGAVVGVVFPTVPAGAVGVGLAALLPPRLHAVSIRTTVKRSIALINRRLERDVRSSCINPLSQRHTDDGNCRKQDDEDDGYIENQAFYSAPCLKYRAGAAASKGTAQSGTSRLQQDKDDYSDAENDLHCLQCRKPLSQILPRFRISTHYPIGLPDPEGRRGASLTRPGQWMVIIYLYEAELYHTIW